MKKFLKNIKLSNSTRNFLNKINKNSIFLLNSKQLCVSNENKEIKSICPKRLTNENNHINVVSMEPSENITRPIDGINKVISYTDNGSSPNFTQNNLLQEQIDVLPWIGPVQMEVASEIILGNRSMSLNLYPVERRGNSAITNLGYIGFEFELFNDNGSSRWRLTRVRFNSKNVPILDFKYNIRILSNNGSLEQSPNSSSVGIKTFIPNREIKVYTTGNGAIGLKREDGNDNITNYSLGEFLEYVLPLVNNTTTRIGRVAHTKEESLAYNNPIKIGWCRICYGTNLQDTNSISDIIYCGTNPNIFNNYSTQKANVLRNGPSNTPLNFLLETIEQVALIEGVCHTFTLKIDNNDYVLSCLRNRNNQPYFTITYSDNQIIWGGIGSNRQNCSDTWKIREIYIGTTKAIAFTAIGIKIDSNRFKVVIILDKIFDNSQ